MLDQVFVWVRLGYVRIGAEESLKCKNKLEPARYLLLRLGEVRLGKVK